MHLYKLVERRARRRGGNKHIGRGGGRQTEMTVGGRGDAMTWPPDFDLEDSCQKQ